MLARAFAPTARLMARGAASSRSASTLIVAEHNNATLHAATLSAVTAAKAIGGDVRTHALVPEMMNCLPQDFVCRFTCSLLERAAALLPMQQL